MPFSRIRDQEFAVRLLNNLLLQNRLPHALLFWGPEGVGKFTTAIALSKILFCKSPEQNDYCGRCSSCLRIDSGNHPDVRIVGPVKKSRTIAVESVEQIQELAVLSPLEGMKKVFILRDADRLTAAGQHKFLKTLEEPPGDCIFVLTTEYPRLLFQTIRSRCQSVRFRRLSTKTVADIVCSLRNVPSDVGLTVAALAQGQISSALDYLDTDKPTIVMDLVQKIKEGVDALELSKDFMQMLEEQKKSIENEIEAELDDLQLTDYSTENREAIREERMASIDAAYRRTLLQYLYLFESWYRDELILSATDDLSHVLNRNKANEIKKNPSRNPWSCIEVIEKARHYLDRQMNEERVLRSLFLDLACCESDT